MAQIKGVTAIIVKIDKFKESRLNRVKTAVEMTQTLIVNDARLIVPVQTGNLQASIQPGPVRISLGMIEGEVQANMEYASFVEGGTSRMMARPYLAPSVLKNMGPFKRFVERALK